MKPSLLNVVIIALSGIAVAVALTVYWSRWEELCKDLGIQLSTLAELGIGFNRYHGFIFVPAIAAASCIGVELRVKKVGLWLALGTWLVLLAWFGYVTKIEPFYRAPDSLSA